jgi:predicted PurR-regulated permease PerM
MNDPVEELGPTTPTRLRGVRVASYVLVGLALAFVLWFRLLWALFAGMLVHELVHRLAERAPIEKLNRRTTKALAVSALAIIVVGSLAAVTFAGLGFVRSEGGSAANLVHKLAEILERGRALLPASVAGSLPEDADALNASVVTALREHAGELRTLSGHAARNGAHVFFGMIIGALLALREETGVTAPQGPLARELVARVRLVAVAFRRVVFAQVLIAATNTGLTALFLAVVLPIFGVHLPLTKTLIAFTFVAGLVPVVGNLLSNAAIGVAALSVSLHVAAVCLAYLVLVHKLEYFLNARIVGGQIEARAWELLVAMLVMEAAFGLPGVVAAPIFYAYAKSELRAAGYV